MKIASSVASVQTAIEHIYALVYEFRKSRTIEELHQLQLRQHTQLMLSKPRDEEDSVPEPPVNKLKKPRNRTHSKSKSTGGDDHPPKKKRCVARVEKSDIPVEFEDMEEETKSLLMHPDSVVMCDADNLIEGPDESDDIDNVLIEEELMDMYSKM